MEKKDTFDTMSIRRRLEKLKVESGMDALEFCKIYAPEKCEKSESYARNYISQVFSGGTSINNKQVSIDIEHLLNIVYSDRFPGVTLNYLVYGDETPAKTVEKLDLNPEHWTIAEFCIFLGRIKKLYPNGIETKIESIENEYNTDEGVDTSEDLYQAICFLDLDTWTDTGFNLGGALHAFFSEYDKIGDVPSVEAQRVLYDQIVKAIKKDKRFSEKLSSCGIDDFYSNDENGLAFKGLDIE